MDEKLTVQALGGLRIYLSEEQPLRFESRRAEVLLVYLALTRRRHERDVLAALLWDDRAQAPAADAFTEPPGGVSPGLEPV